LKTILITGVNSGIGLYLAHYLAHRGFRIIGTLRNLDSTPDPLVNLPNTTLVQMSLDHDGEVEIGFEQIKGLCSENGLYALINNAGMVVAGPSTEISMEDFRYQFQINLFAGLRLIQLCLPALKKYGKSARIIHVSSVSGKFGSPFLGPYVASKFAGEGLYESLRRELWSLDIHVIKWVPGSIRTPIWRKQLHQLDRYREGDFCPYLQSANALIEEMEKNSMALTQLHSAVDHSLFSSSPRPEYLIYKKKWLFILLTKFLPVTFVDRMIQKKLSHSKTGIRPF